MRSFIVFALLAAAASNARAAEPTEFLRQDWGPDIDRLHQPVFQATNCVITEVRVYENVLNVWFNGRWPSNVGGLFPDTIRQVFTIDRDESISQATWDFLAQRFSSVRDRPIELTITTDGSYVIRGGGPMFRFPQDRFLIVTDRPPKEAQIPLERSNR